MSNQINEPTQTQEQKEFMKFILLKKQMAKNLRESFDVFIKSLAHIPVSKYAGDEAMRLFNGGLLWAMEGINSVEYQSMQDAPIPAANESMDKPEEAAEHATAVEA